MLAGHSGQFLMMSQVSNSQKHSYAAAVASQHVPLKIAHHSGAPAPPNGE